MNVYDFDKTIYCRDSTVDFYFYCIRRQPGLLLYLPRQLAAFISYGLHRIDKTQMKERFYCFLQGIRDAEAYVDAFWTSHADGIMAWYRKKQQPDDIVISASPQFLLAPICARLGIRHLLASRVDIKTGHYTGKNCHGEEKVRRFMQQFGNMPIDSFYSDSQSDTPLASLACHSYLVQNGSISPWPEANCSRK